MTDFSDEFDISGQLTDFGANSNTPGSWSVTITPEPAGYMLIGAGLLGILALALTKQAPAYMT